MPLDYLPGSRTHLLECADGGLFMASETQVEKYHGLDASALVSAYRNMYRSRKVDDKEIQLKRQNKIFFQINGVGHEAVLTAAAMVVRPGHDWFIAYYRDRALCLALGMTPYEMFLQGTGAKDDPASGGRQMPAHWGHKKFNLVSKSSCTGMQFLNAVGLAEAGMRMAKLPTIEAHGEFHKDELVYVSGGDGQVAEGEFWESLNTACNLKLPVLYLIEDNGYAISVPVEVTTAGGSISKLVRGFPNLFITEVDGCDFVESYDALRYAIEYCRQRKGPALVHAHVVRPYSHSVSDDERLYRPEAERERDRQRDPLTSLARLLVEEHIATPEELTSIHAEIDARVEADAEKALSAPRPEPESALQWVYSDKVDPTGPEFETEKKESGDPHTMVDLLNACMRDEMARDPRIVMFGEDVADASRPEVLAEVKGKGGVFKVTHGLQRLYGPDRVYNSPLAEANIIGRAVGMAVRGLKPVVEIQFFDYIWPAYMQLRNELATMRWRSGGHFSAPMVVRVPVGGYIAGALYHSQCDPSLFTHIPGLRVVLPSNAQDANGLLRTAIRCDDPVMFLEHKHLYRQTYNKGLYPGSNYCIPFGKAKLVREGTDVTLVCYGAQVQRSIVAAARVGERAGVSTEILDLRSLSPYDWSAISASVKKTNKVIVCSEDPISWGYGSEIAAR